MSRNPLIRKLSSYVDLSDDEQRAVEAWCSAPISLPARRPFIRAGERPESFCVILQGWAYRYVDSCEGNRQIVGLLMPGDFGDGRAFLLSAADHTLAMLDNALIASISRQAFLDTTHAHPRLAEALSWSALVDEGISRYWLVNIGQRGATHRIANLFCELWTRASAVGLVSDDQLILPLTQQDLGDAVGLTTVHVNRTLKALQSENLVTLTQRRLTIKDFGRLKRFSGFDPRYLQLDRRLLSGLSY